MRTRQRIVVLFLGAATKVRREMGYETAGATLGHTNMSATAIYAERNQGLADEAASVCRQRKVGQC